MHMMDGIKKLILGRSVIPSNKDIESAINVSSFLKGKNEKESITNVMDYIDRNFEYWYERADGFSVIMYAFLLLYIVTSLLIAPFIPFNYLVLAFVPAILFISFPPFGTYHIIIYYLVFLSALAIPVMITIMQNVQNLVPILSILCVTYGVLIGVIVGNLVTMYVKYMHYSKKRQGFAKLGTLQDMIRSTFGMGLSVENMLNYRVGICRDYARLTSAILANLNIDHKFVSLKNHVAVAVKIDGEYFVIDQRSPIVQFDKWLSIHASKKADVYGVKFVNKQVYSVELINKKYRIRADKLGINLQNKDLERIQKEINEIFPVKQKNNDWSVKSVLIKDAAYFYDNCVYDSIMSYISREISNIPKNIVRNISHITILQDEKNLIAEIYN